jgi:hypothetical protein
VAEIPFAELVEVIKSHPDYPRWKLGVSADTALYISFDGQPPTGETLRSDDFEAANGRIVVLNRDGEGRIRGLEIT